MTYQCTQGTEIIRTDDGAVIPADSGNRDWCQYESWLAAGNVPEPYVAPPAPIADITKRQALLFLLSIGKSEADVLSAIDSIGDAAQKAAALIAWQYPDRGMLKRNNPLFDQLGPALGIATSTDMDAAFTAAAAL